MLYAEDFSPNTVQGACPVCHGIGRVYEATEERWCPDASLTIRQRAIASWPPAWQGQNLRDILVSLGYDVDTPWKKLPKKDRDWILFTDERRPFRCTPALSPKQTRQAVAKNWEPSYQGTFVGARRYVLDTFATTKSALMKKRVAAFCQQRVCPACHGKRLKPEALSVTFAGLDISRVRQAAAGEAGGDLGRVAGGTWAPNMGIRRARFSIWRARAGIGRAEGRGRRVGAPGGPRYATDDQHSAEKQAVAQRIAGDLLERLRTIIDSGLGYLSLDRSTPTLSSGELQRLRLATQLHRSCSASSTSSTSHPQDCTRADLDALLGVLHGLKAAGTLCSWSSTAWT